MSKAIDGHFQQVISGPYGSHMIEAHLTPDQDHVAGPSKCILSSRRWNDARDVWEGEPTAIYNPDELKKIGHELIALAEIMAADEAFE